MLKKAPSLYHRFSNPVARALRNPQKGLSQRVTEASTAYRRHAKHRGCWRDCVTLWEEGAW